jgi:RHS repeat-associated protein
VKPGKHYQHSAFVAERNRLRFRLEKKVMIRLAALIHLNTATAIRYACSIALLLALLSSSVTAQRLGAGTTFPGIEPGAPAGSYALSGFDTVNLYNGNLNLHLPLFQSAGRGGAQHTIMLSIEQRWSMVKFVDPETNTISYGANPSNWAPYRAGYGPGVLIGRAVDYQPDGCPPPGPILPAASLTRLTFIAPDGTEIELRDQLYEGQPINHTSCWLHPMTSRGKVFRSYDGSAMTFISENEIRDVNFGETVHIDPTGYLLMRDGTRYRIEEGLVKWIRDRNGNRLTFTYDEFSRVKTITDSLGRLVEIDYYNPPSLTYDRIKYTGFGAAQREIRVYYASMSQVLEQGFTIQTLGELFPPPDPLASPDITPHNPLKVSEVRLPDNRSYQFRYNSHGELARVTLPTGGVIKYDWENGPNTLAGGVLAGPFLGIFQGQNLAIYRRVKQRWVYPDGTTLEGSTKYSADENSPLGTVVRVDHLTASSQAPPKSVEKHYFYGAISVSLVYGNGPYGELVPTDYPDWREGREYQTEALDSNGTTMLRRRFDNWQQRAPVSWWLGLPDDAPSNDPRITETVTTLLDVSPNQVSKQTFIYDDFNNVKDAYEYDFGTGAPGSLVRRTHTDYLVTNNGKNYTTVNNSNWVPDNNQPSAEMTIHIRNLPEEQIVYDANGVARAKTRYEYDKYSPLNCNPNCDQNQMQDRPGIIGLFARVENPTQPYVPTDDHFRGNVTKVSRFLLANTGLVTQDQELKSFSLYDIAGNVVAAKDLNGNYSQVGYSAAFQFAYPISTTSPVPDPSGTHGSNQALTSATNYDFSTGKAISATDANGKTTSFEYNDSLDRLTRVVRPSGGGETTYTYGDSVGNLYVQTKTLMSFGVWLESHVLYDGLGRIRRTARREPCELWNPPSSPISPNAPCQSSITPWSLTETKYDALGRVEQVSNPFFGQDIPDPVPSGTWTTTTYDALGRVTRVTTPDGSHVDTVYSGNQVTVTDQQGKKRGSVTDALGRLVRVIEDPTSNGLNYRTDYSYDVLGNLIRVRQGGFFTPGSNRSLQYRSFYYDSLSRLVFANNPEQDATIVGPSGSRWTMKYEYDNNGNLTKRTDARNVVANYFYDALNRNIQVTYSDGTPQIDRFYDNPASGANGKGRLHRVETNNLDPLNSGQVAYSRTIINGYNAMGSVTSQTQRFARGAAATPTWNDFTVTRNYDLIGNVTLQTYPSPSKNVTYEYDSAGRLRHFYGNLGDGVPRNYAVYLNYNAAGQLLKEGFGTNTATYHYIDYNSRFQMVESRLSTSFNNPGTWNRGKLVFSYHTGDATKNNGNVMRQEHYVPLAVNDSTGAVTSFAVPMRDDYEYDAVNRLLWVKGKQQDANGNETPDPIYQQTFIYDQFGNRRIDAAPNQTFGNAINNAVYDVNKANNRIYGMQYDAAGNVINEQSTGGANRYYDAENRMTKAWAGSNWQYYVYDGDGRRVRRIVNGQEYWQVYGIDGELVAEYPAGGVASTPQKEYGYRNGQLLVVAGCDVVRWLVTDHLGTPRMEVDSTGSLASVKRHDYFPFGEELFVGVGGTIAAPNIRTTQMGYLDGTSLNCVRQHLTGKERDNETGLDFFLARYYSSAQGRFTSPDAPFADQNEWDPQSWNLYVYVGNNPLKYTDPFGAWKRVSCSSGDCWEAEEGDTLKTLAKQTGISFTALNWAFGRILTQIKPGETVVNITGVRDELRAYAEDVARKLPMFEPAGGGGIIKLAPSAARGTASLLSRAWSGIRGVFRKPSSGADNVAQYELYKASLRRLMSKPIVNDSRLQEILDDLYRPNATIGSGSTADAIRHELATGQPVGGVWHSQKGGDYIRALEKWIKSNPSAGPSDIHAAKQVLLDLKNALGKGNVTP